MTGRAAGGADPSGHETDWIFREGAAEPPTQAVPYSHLSVELGHLYMEDFAAGPQRLLAHFTQVAPWVETAARALARTAEPRKPRISTCFLIDDYFTRFSSPAEIIPLVTDAAARAGLRIDYIARESGCATADGVQVAALLLARLVASPPAGGHAGRPSATESGWLANGTRSPGAGTPQAMSPASAWEPPLEFGAHRHSVFLDAELWADGPGDTRQWACPLLGAVWQMLRLGLLRDHGEAVMPVHTWSEEAFPEEWDALPPLIRLDRDATPFCAYRTFSVLGSRFLPVEHAVRVILEHTAADADALAQVAERSAKEGVPVPSGLSERVMYAFVASESGQGGDA
ncbi:SCO2522 family protein [Streptomyces violaceus]|uniref:SCO2522 family protein n=1 Tax=Streptomyces violaceus TaxID=1936 RepID=UPI002E24C1F7